MRKYYHYKTRSLPRPSVPIYNDRTLLRHSTLTATPKLENYEQTIQTTPERLVTLATDENVQRTAQFEYRRRYHPTAQLVEIVGRD